MQNSITRLEQAQTLLEKLRDELLSEGVQDADLEAFAHINALLGEVVGDLQALTTPATGSDVEFAVRLAIAEGSARAALTAAQALPGAQLTVAPLAELDNALTGAAREFVRLVVAVDVARGARLTAEVLRIAASGELKA